MARKRRKFSAEFKHRVALAAVSERKTLSELAQEYDLHPNQIMQWEKVRQQDGQNLFHRKNKVADTDQTELVERLYQQIGQLQFELNWLKKNLDMGLDRKRLLVEAQHPRLNIERQCELLGMSRSSYYYAAQSNTPEYALRI